MMNSIEKMPTGWQCEHKGGQQTTLHFLLTPDVKDGTISVISDAIYVIMPTKTHFVNKLISLPYLPKRVFQESLVMSRPWVRFPPLAPKKTRLMSCLFCMPISGITCATYVPALEHPAEL